MDHSLGWLNLESERVQDIPVGTTIRQQRDRQHRAIEIDAPRPAAS